MEVEVVIKAPNQNYADYSVHCNLDWTIKNLKKHLAKAYPTRPKVNEQKLIYSGRLLSNHLRLKDILRWEDSDCSVHIFHLVCKSDSFSQQQPGHTCSHSISRGPQTVNNPVSVQSGGFIQGNMASAPPVNTFYPQFSQPFSYYTAVPFSMPDPQTIAQIAAMQQAHAYHFTQYMQSMYSGLVSAALPAYPNVPQPIPVASQPEDRPQEERAVLEEIMEDFLNRDWLDYMFQGARFIVLFLLVFCYSTPERLMIVLVFAAIAFLYQEGWFMRRVAALPTENPNADNSEDEPLLVDADNNSSEDLLGEYELEAAMDGDDPPHAQRSNDANNNRIFSPLTFLSTFFSSLIPDPPPPPININ